MLGDVSTGEFRPLLPPQFRPAAFLSLHNIAHPGIRATCRLVSSRFCWPQMSKQVPPWHGLASTASAAKCTSMFTCSQSRLRFLAAVLLMFMLIWSALFPAQLVSLTSSQSWTGRPAGRKLYRSPPCPPPTAQPVSFMGGSSGSACQQPSPVIEVRNSLLLCGLHCAPSSTSLICRPLPLIPRQTAPWSDFTAGLRMRCGPAQLGPTGTPICLGFCSASGLLGEKTHHSLQPRKYLEHNQSFQASFSALQNRRRRHSFRSCSEP